MNTEFFRVRCADRRSRTLRIEDGPHSGPYKIVFVALILTLMISGCGRPAQIGGDKGTMKAVDALYTAVGLRDEKLVDECAARLKSLRDEEKIPRRAFASLESIVAEAKSGKWESSQNRLIKFMEGQTR